MSTSDGGAELDMPEESANTKLQTDSECKSEDKTSCSLPTSRNPAEKCCLVVRASPARDEARSSSSHIILIRTLFIRVNCVLHFGWTAAMERLSERFGWLVKKIMRPRGARFPVVFFYLISLAMTRATLFRFPLSSQNKGQSPGHNTAPSSLIKTCKKLTRYPCQWKSVCVFCVFKCSSSNFKYGFRFTKFSYFLG